MRLLVFIIRADVAAGTMEPTLLTVYYPVPAGLAPAGQDGGALYREKRLHRDFSAHILF